jgi:hypothetical protein
MMASFGLRRSRVALLCLVCLAAGSAPLRAQDWERADAAVRRLDPGAFPQLPAGIAQYRGGSVSDVDELARRDDATFLQVVGGTRRIGYSRAIRVATPADIRAHGRNPTMTHADHEGIDDVFVGKASTILYWSGSRWVELHGSN